MAASSTAPWAQAALSQILAADAGFDVVIVCTSDRSQEENWQGRLQATRGTAAAAKATILAVNEGDWSGGAGNGLGSLYAYQNARDKAQRLFQMDLDAALAGGASVAIYHTAGKGTRLAPLPGSHTNNKPAVGLCSLVEVGGEQATTELSILEAVIKQTGAYAQGRRGRVSVFWGDQIFVPSNGALPSGSHHADILANLGPMPTADEWRERSMDKYGLIAVRDSGEAVQVEKVTHEQAVSLFGGAEGIERVGPSLGSFSVSSALLQMLLAEFDAELKERKGKLDSDPHFWMPLTLSRDGYVRVMGTKGVAEAEAGAHYDRMAAFKGRLLEQHPGQGVFGCIDVGSTCYWWDYGQLAFFYKNSLLATGESAEAQALRTFLGIEGKRVQKTERGTVVISPDSIVLNSYLGIGDVGHSVLSSVACDDIDAVDCVLVNVTAKRIRAKACVLYNVVDSSEEGLILDEGDVRADVFQPAAGHPTPIRSKLDIDGGKAWYDKVEGNPLSFDEVHKLNQKIDLAAAIHEMLQLRSAARSALECTPKAQ